MTTLSQIGATVLAGFFVHIVAIFFFGIAVKFRSTNIAPRCEARPRDVIYNPNPTDVSQDRGNPWLGWVPWVLKLSYEEMIHGVAGTGTRDGGLAGSMLRVNLDNIVMLRYHSYGLRVTTLGVFLYILVLLPLYWTAGCTGDEAVKLKRCNITNYERTTLNNIFVDTSLSAELVGFSARLYVVVLCSWILTWYACYELKSEWKDILALRRYHFLEGRHFQGSKRHFDSITSNSCHGSNIPITSKAVAKKKHGLQSHKKQKVAEPDYLKHRQPWIPHPEQPDTPPSIALFSVLVGSIPSKPVLPNDDNEDDNEDDNDFDNDVEMAKHDRSNREWQLSITSAFFDHCIPNQPGFSSSVAAVTILPNAQELAAAWRKWYAAAAKLRRLRFIRRQIREQREETLEKDGHDVHANDVESNGEQSSCLQGMAHTDSHSSSNTLHSQSSAGPRTDYNREILGSALDEDVEELFLEALEFGPEQSAVYAREFAQSAAPLCPNGCFEGSITGATMDELLDMEQAALEDVQEANKALEAARLRAIMNAHIKDQHSQKMRKGKYHSPKRAEGSKTRLKTTDRIVPDLHGGSVVKLLVDSDAVKNLMGKEHGNLSDGKKSFHRKGAHSLDKIELSSDFDLEVKLLNKSNTKLGSCSSVERKRNSKPNGMGGHMIPLHSSTDSKPFKDYAAQINDLSEISALDVDGIEDFDTTVNRASTVVDQRHPLKTHKLHRSELPSFDCEQGKRHGHRHILSEPDFSGFTLPTSSESRPSLQKQQGSVNVFDPWAVVGDLANHSKEDLENQPSDAEDRILATGIWEISSISGFCAMLRRGATKLLRWTTQKSNQAVDLVAADSTYAVVTFTSRQAAVAARKVLADGRGAERFLQIDTLPIPPLADAAACDLMTCRGCCRPVTLSINDRQKKWRKYISLVTLGIIYFFYTFPLTSVASYASSNNLKELFPGLEDFKTTYFNAEILSSFLVALLWAIFFAGCPILFKTIANFGSNATSNVEAEFWALKAFWWFMVLSAFSGTSLQRMLLDGFNDGIRIGSEIQSVVNSIAATIPVEVSATWINWIIVKYSVTGPLMYTLQLNTFLFSWAGLKCCARAVRGGGPGGPLPYRVYVDGGVVLLCLFALAPASPLVAPFSFLYFLVSIPTMRRNVIFMYRPKFDAGGLRWEFLSDMTISGLFVGQILLCAMMVLKKSLGPALLAFAPFIPTFLFRDSLRKRYLKPFADVGLLQTSLLDGWDTADPETMDMREERRKFLVDSHKASYVPVCVAGTKTDEVLTAEPAVVVPTIQEVEAELESRIPDVSQVATGGGPKFPNLRDSLRRSSKQFGATMRRATTGASNFTQHRAFSPDTTRSENDTLGSKMEADKEK